MKVVSLFLIFYFDKYQFSFLIDNYDSPSGYRFGYNIYKSVREERSRVGKF